VRLNPFPAPGAGRAASARRTGVIPLLAGLAILSPPIAAAASGTGPTATGPTATAPTSTAPTATAPGATTPLAPAPAPGDGTPAKPGPLQRTLNAWGRAHPATSALVWRLDGSTPVPILAFRPDVARLPASTMKIVTSAGALLTLGPGFRFETRLYAGVNAVQRGRVLSGPLYIKGYGDPLLSTPAYARNFFSGRGGNLGRLAGGLSREGISLVRGPLVADETFFDAERTGPDWKASYTSECSPLSGLTVNQNFTGDGRGAHVASPPLAAAQRLRGAMGATGVRQVGALRPGRAPTRGRLLATVKSPPLRQILAIMNPASDNFIAETLMKDVGAYGRAEGRTRAGTAETAALLRARGILGAQDRLVDGSGLSRGNRISASTMVRLLAAADQERATWGGALMRSLEHGGEGTLRRRLRGPDAGRVRAKTGYINGVSGLAGTVTSRAGHRFAFAFFMNDWDIGGAHNLQDQIVAALASGVGDRAAPLPS
jgi:serine-type D-Ala-D-Ala carboxypeptidase/endopeptidase (penicillin-binding protein 4)